MAAVRSPRATPGTKPPTPSGGGWFDVGGKERIELASRNEALGEEVRLKEAQLRMLRVLQKTSAREGRIDRWRLQTTAPVFSAWRRAVTAWRAERQLEAERAARAAAVSAAEEKGGQVGALADRVARVKSNAQAKLSELSAANQLLAKALRGPQPPAEAVPRPTARARPPRLCRRSRRRTRRPSRWRRG